MKKKRKKKRIKIKNKVSSKMKTNQCEMFKIEKLAKITFRQIQIGCKNLLLQCKN